MNSPKSAGQREQWPLRPWTARRAAHASNCHKSWYLHVSRLRFLDSLVVFIAGLRLAHQVFVDLLQALSQNAQVLLNLGLLLLRRQNLTVHFLALLAKIVNALHKFIVIVLKRGTFTAGRLLYKQLARHRNSQGVGSKLERAFCQPPRTIFSAVVVRKEQMQG